jgi:N-dimethylarginine dimethylaminohydrolase
MTLPAPDRTATPATPSRPREYLMADPAHFRVDYAINPWMDPTAPVDNGLAVKQWQRLRETLVGLGHSVHVLDPAPDLPDLVYAANGALVLDGTAYLARFHFPQRARETDLHRRWFAGAGWRTVDATATHEGEGDLAYAGGVILAGHGFRTDPAAHREAGELFGRPVIPLHLVDPRFYHLDTALAVLDQDGPGRVAYYPGAFSEPSRAELRRRYPDAIVADEADATAFGLNMVSDGRHVVVNAEATAMAAKLAAAG